MSRAACALVVAGVLAADAPASARAPSDAPRTGARTVGASRQVAATILQLERQLMVAMKLRDADALDRLTAESFTFISIKASGDMLDKARFIDDAMTRIQVIAYGYDDELVRLFGNTAVVTARLRMTASFAEHDWSGDFLVTDVWVKNDTHWQIVARHQSRLPPRSGGPPPRPPAASRPPVTPRPLSPDAGAAR